MENNQSENKKMTLDDLAAMVQRGFAEMNTRFDHIERILLSQQEKRIEKLEGQMSEIRKALALEA